MNEKNCSQVCEAKEVTFTNAFLAFAMAFLLFTVGYGVAKFSPQPCGEKVFHPKQTEAIAKGTITKETRAAYWNRPDGDEVEVWVDVEVHWPDLTESQLNHARERKLIPGPEVFTPADSEPVGTPSLDAFPKEPRPCPRNPPACCQGDCKCPDEECVCPAGTCEQDCCCKKKQEPCCDTKTCEAKAKPTACPTVPARRRILRFRR